MKGMTLVAVISFVVVAIIGPYKDYATAYEFATTNLGFVAVTN